MLETSTVDAVVEGGVFRPDQPIELPEGTRVTLVVQPSPPAEQSFAEKFACFEDLRARSPIHLAGEKFRRDELYDRR